MILSRIQIKSVFTIICWCVVCYMIGYWWYKYLDDRDIGVVDISAFKESKEIRHPSVTLCWKNPFILEKLQTYNSSIDKKSYRRYLRGKMYKDEYARIDYNRVSIDLSNYQLAFYEIWRNESAFKPSSLNIQYIEVFSGFAYDMFMKCFWVKHDIEKHHHIKGFSISYDFNATINDPIKCRKTRPKLFYKINYPDQFFLGDGLIEADPCENTGMYVWIDELEILERRNSRNRECLDNSKSFDLVSLNKFMSGRICRPPYLTDQIHHPICNNRREMIDNQVHYDTLSSFAIPKACNRIAKMSTTDNPEQEDWQEDWTFSLMYPNEVKIISQNKEIDIHTLIGNIGGYIGLLLGKKLI